MADITIRGAGIFGLSIAWACLQRGATVQVVDPHGVGAGSSGGVVGALAPHIPEQWDTKKAFQLDSLLMSKAFWADVESCAGKSTSYGRTGRLQPVLSERGLDLARSRQKEAQILWGEHATWTVIDDVPDWAPISTTGYYIFDTLSARLHPRMACDALAAAIAARGGVISNEAPDQGAVLWATGVQGLAALEGEVGREFGNGQKGQAALLRPQRTPPDNAPQLFADFVHVIPHADGTVAIGSTSERYYDDPNDTDALLETLIDRAIAAVPYLSGAQVIQRWAGLRPRSTSRAPILGKHPVRKGHFIANGGFKIGFGMAPKIAETMADLLLDGNNTIPSEFEIKASW